MIARWRKRKLADFQREIGRVVPGASRMTVAQLCDKYLETQQHLEKSTRDAKGRIVRQISCNAPVDSSGQQCAGCRAVR